MSLKILIDMNLSPKWVSFLENAGLTAVHWSTAGDVSASDQVIFQWARESGFVIFTHDFDFGMLLALTHASGPSVVQLRGIDVLPDRVGELVLSVIKSHSVLLQAGALVVIDPYRLRVRILPL